MSRGIEYRKDGTIVVHLDRRYVVEPPNADSVMKWEEEIIDNADEVRDKLDDYRQRLTDLDETTTEYRALEREFNKFARSPNYSFSMGWLERAFTQCVDNFPPRGEWPAFLLNTQLPIRFCNHWKTVPLVSGDESSTPPTPANDG